MGFANHLSSVKSKDVVILVRKIHHDSSVHKSNIASPNCTRWYPWGDTAISLYILQPPLTVVMLLWGWGGGVLRSQNPKCQEICLNFNLGGFWNQIPEQGCSGEFGIWSKISGSMCFGSLACWCITVSLSHTTYVETNKMTSPHLPHVLGFETFFVRLATGLSRQNSMKLNDNNSAHNCMSISPHEPPGVSA